MGINCYYCNIIIKTDIKQLPHSVMKNILIQCCIECYYVNRIKYCCECGKEK